MGSLNYRMRTLKGELEKMAQILTKYEAFLLELQAAAPVADIQSNGSKAAQAINGIVSEASATAGLPSIIDHQNDSSDKMVTDYVNYIWKGGPKPSWLQQAGL